MKMRWELKERKLHEDIPFQGCLNTKILSQFERIDHYDLLRLILTLYEKSIYFMKPLSVMYLLQPAF